MKAAGRARAGIGIAYILASGLSFGSMPIFARWAYRDGLDPSSLLLLRFTIAAACMWTLFLAKRLAWPRGRGLALLLVMGGVGYAGQAFCYFTAITMASAGLVSLLLYLYPALVTLLARVLFRHPLSARQLGAVAIALAGSALTIGRAPGGRPLGIVLGLGCALIYSCYILAGSRIPAAIRPTTSTAVITSAAALVYAGVALVRGLRLPASAGGWAAVAGVALVSTVMAILFFFEGMERVGPVRASVYSTVEPLFTLFLAALLLGERITATRLAGGALILAAVILLAREELRSSPAARAARRSELPRPLAVAPPPTGEG